MSLYKRIVIKAKEVGKNLVIEPIFPLLFVIYPILFLYLHNINELTVEVLFIPLLVSILFSCILFLALNQIIKNWTKSAFILTIWIGVIYLYQPTIDLLPHVLIKLSQLEITRGQVIMPIAAVIALGLPLFLIKAKIGINSNKLNKILNYSGLALVIITLFQIGFAEYSRMSLSQGGLSNNSLIVEASKLNSKPDIYYIVFDRYAGEKTLEEFYNYDNSDILNFLESKNFYVAHDSRSNYPSTDLSIASTLNMEYHPSQANHERNLSIATDIYPIYKNPRVAKELKSLGYNFYQYPAQFTWISNSEIADGIFKPSSSAAMNLDDFSYQLISQTIFPSLAEQLLPGTFGFDYSTKMRDAHLWQIEHLPNAVELPGPKFVFAHVLLPHDPYVMNANCESLPYNQFTAEHSVERYLQQLQCANKIIKSLVNTYLAEGDTEPIIIIQADEGPHTIINQMGLKSESSNDRSKHFEGASQESVDERTRILNAYYFPDGDYSQLYQDITPINTFRTILRQYYGYDLRPLEDKTFIWPSLDRQFEFYEAENIK